MMFYIRAHHLLVLVAGGGAGDRARGRGGGRGPPAVRGAQGDREEGRGCGGKTLGDPGEKGANTSELFRGSFPSPLRSSSRRALALAVTTQISRYCNISFHILAVHIFFFP